MRSPVTRASTRRSGVSACHAGRFETSVVLAERPDLVRDGIRAELPANPASLSRAIREGKTSFEAAGGPRAYFGWPADATAEEGRALIDALGGILEQAVQIPNFYLRFATVTSRRVQGFVPTGSKLLMPFDKTWLAKA